MVVLYIQLSAVILFLYIKEGTVLIVGGLV